MHHLERANEEVDLIRNELKTTIDNFCHRHEHLVVAAESANFSGMRAAIYKRILLIENTMTELWTVGSNYLGNIPTMPQVVLGDELAADDEVDDIYLNLSEHSSDSDDSDSTDDEDAETAYHVDESAELS